MVPHGWLVLLLAASVIGSGCITPLNETDERDGADVPATPVLQSDTVTHEEDVGGPQVVPQESVVAGPWSFPSPEALETLDVSLTWTAEQNAFRLRVTTPSGETVTRSGTAQNASFRPAEAAPGTYTFEAVATGVVVQDTLRLRIGYTWLELPDADTDASGLVTYVQEGNKWRATIGFATQEPDAKDLTLDVDTFNGAIDVENGKGPAKATLQAWARADSKERAGELVRMIQVTLGVDGDRLVAHARDVSDRSGSESTGASVSLRVPGQVSGLLDTSNGGVRLTGIRTTGLQVDTSNGLIAGDLMSSGDVTLDTSNGGIDLEFTPSRSLALAVETSNGAIHLTLKESGDIGYRLDADTSNGGIQEDMDEAALSGSEDDEKRLETDGFASRKVQVTGSVHTSNANIRFEGA